MKRMKPSRKRFLNLALPSAIALALCSCIPASAQDCEVKIGFAGPLTGGASPWGLAKLAGTKFEAAWANSHGGIQMGDHKCKVAVYSYNSKSDVAGAAAASNYFAGKGIHVVVGPVTTPEITGWQPVAARNQQVDFSSSYAAHVISPKYPLAFSDGLDPTVWGPIVFKLAKDRFHFKTAVILGPNDQAGTDAAKPVSAVYNKIGVKPTVEYYQRGTTNFAAIVTRVMADNPGVVELASMPPGDAGLFAQQMRQAGYDGVFDRSGAGASTIIQIAGGPKAIKDFFWQDAVPLDDPGILRMNSDYERLMGEKPPQNSLLYSGQIATELYLRAISKAGTDTDAQKIAAALRAMTPENRYLGKAGWRGKDQYGINQQLAFPVGMGIIQDGKQEPEKRVAIPSE